jgi:hypothetical protein
VIVQQARRSCSSKRARDFDQLLLWHRELAYFRIGVNFGANAL